MDERDPDAPRGTIALLGTGRIGVAVARRLLAAGYAVRVWNRTAARAAPLALDGAYVAPVPAAAADGADVLITLLSDAQALRAAANGPRGALVTLRFGALWVQMADIGVDESARLRQLALGHGVRYVDAPFAGTEEAARDGELMVLASGQGSARVAAEPVLGAIARETLWVGHPGGGSWLKHALGTWVGALPEGSAGHAALSAALGLDCPFPDAAG